MAPKVDPENRELALSIGAFLENLIAGAPGHGYGVDYSVVGKKSSDEDLIQVRLSPRAEEGRETLERIRLRRTVRKGLARRALRNEDVRELLQHFDVDGGVGATGYFFPRDSSQGRYLAEATIEANRAQAARDDAQRELADWIRFSNKEARVHRDGLTQESMEITGFAGWYVRNFMNRSSVMEKMFREQGVEQVREQVENSGGWLLVSSPNSSLLSLLEAGRRTEQMWLRARDRKIGIHPMTQILEEPPFQDQVGRQLGIADPLQFILRVGFVESYRNPVSLRRPVSDILLS